MSTAMLFRCCVMQQSTQTQQTARKRRPPIDRSMIGLPTNFQHTGHIGSADVGGAGSQVDCTRMQTKGGYGETSSVVSHLKLRDLPTSLEWLCSLLSLPLLLIICRCLIVCDCNLPNQNRFVLTVAPLLCCAVIVRLVVCWNADHSL